MSDNTERDCWIRLFNRLDASVSHHKKNKSAMFVDEVDEALYAARDKILRDAGTPHLYPRRTPEQRKALLEQAQRENPELRRKAQEGLDGLRRIAGR